MNTRVVLDSLLALAITLGGSLALLFSQPDVTNFGDISPLSYAIALITAVVTTAKTLQSRLADSPENVKQADQIVAAAASLTGGKRQAGYAQPLQLFATALFAFGLLSVVTACSQFQSTPETPRQQLLAAYGLAETAAQSVGLARQADLITAEQRDDTLNKIRAARSTLNDIRTTIAAIPAGQPVPTDTLALLTLTRNVLQAVYDATPTEPSP